MEAERPFPSRILDTKFLNGSGYLPGTGFGSRRIGTVHPPIIDKDHDICGDRTILAE